jgi:DNA-binding NtrC family response regulator
VAHILLIDDDAKLSRFLRLALEECGHLVECLERAESGPDVLATGEFNLVLLDNHLPGMTGIEFLGDLRRRGIRLPVILMTGHDTTDTAIQATKEGAYDYVIKPLDARKLVQELGPLIREVEKFDWRGERVRLPGPSIPHDGPGPELVGASKPMLRVRSRIGRCAELDVPVLIRGETGTGKELVARAIRAYSARKDKPFVVINCTAFNEDQLEDELFGHEPGAFIGAEKPRKGSFEHIDGGTLFLAEVGDLPLRIQGKLLGALENQEVFRRGSSEGHKVNVRLLAATHRDLEAAMREGKFLDKLFYVLNQMPISLPPLRERGPEDLQQLVHHFLAKVAQSTGRPVPTLHEGAWVRLCGHSWPGNIGELQNVIGRAALVCRGPQMTAADVEFDVGASGEGAVLDFIRRAIAAALQAGRTNLVAHLRGILNREMLLLTLNESGGDQEKAARILGAPLRSLLQEDPGGPGAADEQEKPRPLGLPSRALILIANHPEWTVQQLAEALDCSKSTLYRDPIVNRALKAKSGDKYQPPHAGHKSREGDLEAYE